MGRFSIRTRTVDPDGNQTSETLSVKAGPASSDIPQVSFVFPNTVSVKSGGAGGPVWASGVYQGFAFCEVTPTPSDVGTGSFLVQHYYNSGNYPNNPDRRFANTFRGIGTTIVNDWYYNTQSLLVNGGGVAGSGFAQSADLSGLRQAVVLSTQDQSSEEVPGDDGIRRVSPSRFGRRTPSTDAIILAYNHDLTDNELQTIETIQPGTLNDGSARSFWPSGTFAFYHPYHYTPVYQNQGVVAEDVLPHILVIEDGNQFSLRGQFTVSGTAVTGQYSELDTQVSGQSAIRFEGDSTWYLVSGVLSSSGLTIYDYGDAPYSSNVGAEITRYAHGSGLISVLPNLVGCDLWDVELTPDYKDGDEIPSRTVTYTAGLVGTGAPSGVAQYDWTVITQGGSTTTYLDQGSSLDVNYPTDDTVKNVRVTVSGAGQPACIHGDETGLISLTLSADAGEWSPHLRSVKELFDNGTIKNIYSEMQWFRRGSTPETDVWFHHWTAQAKPLGAKPVNGDDGQTFSFTTTINFPKGSIDDLPSRGTIVLSNEDSVSADSYNDLFYATYTGKSSGATYDSLTGVTWKDFLRVETNGRILSTATGTGSFASVQGSKYVYMQTQHHFPMTYVVGQVGTSTTSIKVEDARRIVNARLGTNRKFWITAPNRVPDGSTLTDFYGVYTLQSVNFTTNELTFTTELLSEHRQAGSQIIVAPWFHWRNGGTKNIDTDVPAKYWNVNNQSLLMVMGDYQGSDRRFDAGDSFTISEAETFDLVVYDPFTGVENSAEREAARAGFDDGYRYEFTWLPYQGRIIIPNYDRGNLVIEYGSWTRLRKTLQGNSIIRLKNCRLVSSLTTDTAEAGLFTVPGGSVAFVHKNIKVDPTWSITDLNSPVTNIEVADPGNTTPERGRNRTWIDVVQANRDENTDTGNVGRMFSDAVWESIIPGFPTGGIPQVDPIYLRDLTEGASSSEGGTSEGGGGCVHSESLVTVQRNEEIYSIPIKDLKVHDMILTSHGFKLVKAKMEFRSEHAYQFKTEDGFDLVATELHPIAIKHGKMEDVFWVKIKDLGRGDVVYTNEGTSRITDICRIFTPSAIYYDIEVEEPNNFYADGVLVHNKGILDPFTQSFE